MRVTQGMLSNNSVRYLSSSYNRLSELSDQMTSGKKISKPSDDPVVAMNGMRYRSQVKEITQFERNLNEGFSWLDNADSALNETGEALQRIRELTVQASNDSYESSERGNIADEIQSLQEHLVSLADTKVGDTYIFSGTATDRTPINENLLNIDYNKFVAESDKKDFVISYQGQTFKNDSTDASGNTFIASNGEKMIVDPATNKVTYQYEFRNGETENYEEKLTGEQLVISHVDAVSNNTEDVMIEVMKGIKIPMNVQPQGAFSIKLFSGLESIKKMLNDPNTKGEDITKSLEHMDQMLNAVVSTRSELGARTNRAEMVENRLSEQEVIAIEMVSKNEDVDLEEVFIQLTIQQSI
ncbi:MAG TPA: flagellar hook-associated protein FlgL, partial [Bacillus sp. (in: firmicutes)]|nr:flagellar hook-associated protein FlgL [Bacillus sp. (in: firmicutes)]